MLVRTKIKLVYSYGSFIAYPKCIVNVSFFNLFCFDFSQTRFLFSNFSLAHIVVGSESTRSLLSGCLLAVSPAYYVMCVFFLRVCATQNDKINKIIRECC